MKGAGGKPVASEIFELHRLSAPNGQKTDTRRPRPDPFDGLWKPVCDWLYDRAIIDRAVAVMLAPMVVVALAVIWPIAIFCQGRPFLYGAKRMKSPNQEFRLWKIRTMRADDAEALSVMGGDQLHRVTNLGRVLRGLRLDEIPQIFNVLAGDVRFIGPRPPLRKYVEAYPDIYAQVLKSKPGITGLATVMLHKREKRLLETCNSAADTDDLYRRACIPIKARLDLFYMTRRSLWLDAFVIYRTFAGLLPEKGSPTRKSAKARMDRSRLPLSENPANDHSRSGEIDSKAA